MARGTYADRYASADSVEYESVPAHRRLRRLDLARGWVGLQRNVTRSQLAPMLVEQRTWDPSVVFTHNLPELVGLIDTNRHRAVLYAHNQLLRTYSRREAGRLLARASAVVCVSEWLLRDTLRFVPRGMDERFVTVHNGVDIERFHPGETDRRGDRLNVVVVGRVIPVKGADVALKALAILNRDDVALTVVGSQGFDPGAPLTRYERSLRELAQRVRSSVRFVRSVPRDEVAALIRQADVMVVPSRWPEPFGNTAIEGLASGLAVVASRVGGLPEVVGDAGLMVEPGDPEALAAALGRLADDSQLLDHLGRVGRARAVQRDWAWAARRLDEALVALT
ncbi:glycosyltransferase family 4 protein [Georgenia muralis]